MDAKAMAPYGQALFDFHNGDTLAQTVILREDGLASELPVGVFFREAADFAPIEQRAQALCRGWVLDVGAGTGCHSLALQARGIRVMAIDVCPQAVEIMAQRGVEDCQRVDVFEYQGGPFDTLLLMMHGIGMVQDLPGLDRFLKHAHRLLRPDGQILLDSLDVRTTVDPVHLAYQEANRKSGRYIGDIRMRFEYQGQSGPLFGWLHVDPETLSVHAERGGWTCRILCQQDSGDYLAQLAPM